jgi:hypothetical protein
MGEYLAPYASGIEGLDILGNLFKKLLPQSDPSAYEGFTDMAGIFSEVLKIGVPRADGTIGPPTSAFLKTLLEQERATADSLINTAKRLQPVVKTLEAVGPANDAAFESEVQAALPKAGASLQSFAVLLLVISYLVLTITSMVLVYNITENPYTVGKTFIGFSIAGVILYSLIIRFA